MIHLFIVSFDAPVHSSFEPTIMGDHPTIVDQEERRGWGERDLLIHLIDIHITLTPLPSSFPVQT
jgi:hypothetical protein